MLTVLTDPQINAIAMLCHEANRFYSLSLGDTSHAPWGEAPDYQTESARKGVRFILEGGTARGAHVSWMNEKQHNGWVYGEVKSEEARTHPCMVDYEDLPAAQKVKDDIFRSVVLGWLQCKVPELVPPISLKPSVAADPDAAEEHALPPLDLPEVEAAEAPADPAPLAGTVEDEQPAAEDGTTGQYNVEHTVPPPAPLPPGMPTAAEVSNALAKPSPTPQPPESAKRGDLRKPQPPTPRPPRKKRPPRKASA